MATASWTPARTATATIAGPNVAFTINDWRGGAWRVQGAIEGDVLKGGIMRVGGDVERMIEVVRSR